MKYRIFIFVFWQFLSIAAFSQKEILIFHTNDTHSQIEPLKNSGLGGMQRIANILKSERKNHPNLFLFDAGDFWQGTPYFNFFGGETEIRLMNALQYDAVTLGNHQFDIPLNFLAQRLSEANFEVVLSNYDVEKTPLKHFIKKFTIIEKNGVKIGVIGLCTNLKGVAIPQNYEGVKYQNPVKIANKLSKKLKRQGCDLVVCLSHLGYFNNDDIDDIKLAEQSCDIDIIIGGHSHTFLEKADVSKINRKGIPVPIVQMGKSGAYLGKIEVTIQK